MSATTAKELFDMMVKAGADPDDSYTAHCASVTWIYGRKHESKSWRFDDLYTALLVRKGDGRVARHLWDGQRVRN